MSIRGVWMVLKRRRAIIFWTAVTCLLVGAVTGFLLPPRYKAVSQIEVQKSATDGLGLENLTHPDQDGRSDALDANLTLQTQAMILQSRALALRVVEDLNLENTADYKPRFSPIGWLLGLVSAKGPKDPANAALEDSPRRRDHVIAEFQKRLRVSPQAGTRLIDIQYTSSDPKIAAAVVNDMTKALVNFMINNRFAATSEVSGWLTGQLGEIKKEAEAQQGKVEALQRESGVYSLGISDAQGKEVAYSATLDQLQQATQALSTATSNEILKGALYKAVQNGDPELISGLAGSSLAGASPGVNGSFVLIQNLRAQQAMLASQLAADTSKYGSSNPKLADEKASLDAVDAQIKDEVARIGERAANDYHAAQIVASRMRDEYEHERQAADNQNDKAIALLIARQEATDSRTLYQTLYSHLKEAGVMQGLRSSNISVTDAGEVPSRPASDRLMALALGLLVGCFLGVVGGLLVDAFDDRIEGISSLENALHTNILAIIPQTNKGTFPKELGGIVFNMRRRLPSGNRDTEHTRVAVLDGPNTAYVEALRGLRTSLLSFRHGHAPKTVLITSAVDDEGKSMLSLNLAAALVLNGSRVLLIDGDLRRTGLSSNLGLDHQTDGEYRSNISGLSSALAANIEPAVQQPFGELPNLWILPAGPVPTYPAELVGSSRMSSLLTTWSQQYDYVLVDSPPMLAVADAMILARLVDTTLLIARHGYTKTKSLERAYRMLRDMNTGSVGVVVNGMRRSSDAYQEFYGYQGGAYYREA